MYIVRADGNAKIGAGHLMRCLTIMEALAKMQGDRQNICFLCADEQSASMVEVCGFQAKVLGTDYQDMESELTIWESLISRDERNVILVDSYYVTDTYLRQLRSYGKVYLMDDMQEHTYPADVVINYNAFADEDSYHQLYAGTGTECFVGRSYVPIRQQFLNRDYRVSEKVKDVLITTGGGDLDNIAGTILQKIYREDMEFHVVTGRYNPHMEALIKMEEDYAGVHIHHDVSDMAGLMQKCDIAVTAGGTTIYELASIGVPFLCFSYAQNQEALTEYIGVNGIAGFLGAYHRNEQAVLENLQVLFTEYCERFDLRKECNEKEQLMIDGKGAVRLAEKMA